MVSGKQAPQGGSSKAGWLLLGAALVLAAGSFGLNQMQDEGADAGAPSGLRGPSAEQVAAASGMDPAEQRQMAQAMVAQLEARLEQEPDSLEGWVMLMRSRMALGEPAKAKAARDAAIRANPAAAAELRAQAAALGID